MRRPRTAPGAQKPKKVNDNGSCPRPRVCDGEVRNVAARTIIARAALLKCYQCQCEKLANESMNSNIVRPMRILQQLIPGAATTSISNMITPSISDHSSQI